MPDESAQLPWDELKPVRAEIPWDAMRTIAEAAPADNDVVHRLFDTYERARITLLREATVADLCVTAIFALAATQFDDAQKRAVGGFLIEKLIEACEEEDDFIPDTLLAACGALGPAILPLVLDVCSSERDIEAAWLWLWDLTALAAECDDEDLRGRAIRACAEMLVKAARGQIDPDKGISAGWALVRCKCTEYADLLERVCDRAELVTRNEYKLMLNVLRGRSDDMSQELWEYPIEELVESRWKMIVDSSSDPELDREVELDEDTEDLNLLRARTVAVQFLLSAPAGSLPPEMRDKADPIIRWSVYLSFVHLDKDIEEWDEPALRKLLTELLPAYLPGDRRVFAMVAPVVETFLYSLGEQGRLPNAEELAREVRGWAGQIVANGLDPTRWGATKKNTMAAFLTGEDVSDPAVQDEIMAHMAEEWLEAIECFTESRAAEPPATEPTPKEAQPTERRSNEPPIPVRQYTPRISRNAPCPCGSGRKYKKCCGRSNPPVESGA